MPAWEQAWQCHALACWSLQRSPPRDPLPFASRYPLPPPHLQLTLHPKHPPKPPHCCSAAIKGFLLQVAVLANHQNGRDSHVRQVGRSKGLGSLRALIFLLLCLAVVLAQAHSCRRAAPRMLAPALAHALNRGCHFSDGFWLFVQDCACQTKVPNPVSVLPPPTHSHPPTHPPSHQLSHLPAHPNIILGLVPAAGPCVWAACGPSADAGP